MNLVFLGPPGSGKGTYSLRLSPLLGIPHISTGDIFRDAIAKKTELGKKVEGYLKRGEFVPDDIVLKVVRERLNQPDCKKGYIFDGFPRTVKQAKELDKITKLEAVLNLVIDESIIIQKTTARRICEKCGDVYNLADIKMGQFRLPPILPKKQDICDKCGGKLIQRPDDTEEIIKERLEAYKRQTQPLIDYYKKKGFLKDIKIVGPPEVMVPRILKIVKGL